MTNLAFLKGKEQEPVVKEAYEKAYQGLLNALVFLMQEHKVEL